MTTSTPVSTTVAQQSPTRWADANTVTFSGRVYNAELVNGRYGEFVSLSIITRPVQDDDSSQLVVVMNSSQLVNYFKAGGIPTGRVVTVTGNMSGIETSYTNKSTGEIVPLQRARVRLAEAFCQWGAKPAKK
jgi:hypothetical protein